MKIWETIKGMWRLSKMHTILFFFWFILLLLNIWAENYYSFLIDGLFAINSINELKWLALEEEMKNIKK